MSVTNVFVHDCIDPQRLDKLRALPNTRVDVIECDDEDEHWHLPDERAPCTEVLVSCFAPNNLNDLRALKLIQISSVGYSQLIGLGLAEGGIRAANAAGVFDVPIAEWNLAMIVNLGRDLRQMIHNKQTQTWDRDARFQTELSGSVVGIWGYGGIGRETARLCKAMDMPVYVMTRNGIKARTGVFCVPGRGDPAGTLPDRVFVPGQERQFLQDLDFLIIALPLTPATEGLIGDRELRMLPQTAYVLNPARGNLIEEQALTRALREGWIAGAALDTHYYYPLPPDHPLWHFPNVIITPHISGSNLSRNFKPRLWDIIQENVSRHIAGKPLLNELTAKQLKG